MIGAAAMLFARPEMTVAGPAAGTKTLAAAKKPAELAQGFWASLGELGKKSEIGFCHDHSWAFMQLPVDKRHMEPEERRAVLPDGDAVPILEAAYRRDLTAGLSQSLPQVARIYEIKNEAMTGDARRDAVILQAIWDAGEEKKRYWALETNRMNMVDHGYPRSYEIDYSDQAPHSAKSAYDQMLIWTGSVDEAANHAYVWLGPSSSSKSFRYLSDDFRHQTTLNVAARDQALHRIARKVGLDFEIVDALSDFDFMPLWTGGGQKYIFLNGQPHLVEEGKVSQDQIRILLEGNRLPQKVSRRLVAEINKFAFDLVKQWNLPGAREFALTRLGPATRDVFAERFGAAFRIEPAAHGIVFEGVSPQLIADLSKEIPTDPPRLSDWVTLPISPDDNVQYDPKWIREIPADPSAAVKIARPLLARARAAPAAVTRAVSGVKPLFGTIATDVMQGVKRVRDRAKIVAATTDAMASAMEPAPHASLGHETTIAPLDMRSMQNSHAEVTRPEALALSGGKSGTEPI